MKKVLLILLFFPLILPAQEPKPSFKNDTLYATCGFKIYKGLVLQFGKGTEKKGTFRFIKIKNGVFYHSLVQNSIMVKEVKNFGITEPGTGTIEITGTIIFKDSSKGTVEIELSFDKAIENSPVLPTELIVPAEFRNSSRVRLSNELNRLFNLYKDGVITKADYEEQKKKLLEQ